jgi:pyruvate/2-oxoglutarate dehydrogenase complex dihydrolipoamide dehydrogenase (E3) component
MVTGSTGIDMERVRQRKRDMVDGLVAMHRDHYGASGAELIMGAARFVGPKTLEVQLNDGGTRTLEGERVFLNLGTHATIPPIRGLADAGPLTRTSSCSSSTGCPSISSSSAADTSVWNSPRRTAASEAG